MSTIINRLTSALKEAVMNSKSVLQSGYSIRPAVIDDVEAIRRMQAQSWLDTYGNDEVGATREWLAEETASWFTDEALAHSREHLGACFANPDHFYRVGLLSDEIVGLLHLATNEDGTKHLWGLYTAQKTHGTGLAQELMALANEWIGDNEVDLEVVTYNTRAIRFYEKNGFEIIPGENELFKGKLPNISMIRKGGKR